MRIRKFSWNWMRIVRWRLSFPMTMGPWDTILRRIGTVYAVSHNVISRMGKHERIYRAAVRGTVVSKNIWYKLVSLSSSERFQWAKYTPGRARSRGNGLVHLSLPPSDNRNSFGYCEAAQVHPPTLSDPSRVHFPSSFRFTPSSKSYLQVDREYTAALLKWLHGMSARFNGTTQLRN